MNNLSNAQAESYDYEPDQDSYIAINQEGIVVDQCPIAADLLSWMGEYTEHHFLITSTTLAMNMIGKPLPDGDIEVMLL